MSGANEIDVEDLIEAVGSHGIADPELEITVLRDLLRTAWALMSEGQRADLIESDEAQSVLSPDQDGRRALVRVE